VYAPLQEADSHGVCGRRREPQQGHDGEGAASVGERSRGRGDDIDELCLLGEQRHSPGRREPAERRGRHRRPSIRGEDEKYCARDQRRSDTDARRREVDDARQ
jgi:hypothetical protein